MNDFTTNNAGGTQVSNDVFAKYNTFEDLFSKWNFATDELEFKKLSVSYENGKRILSCRGFFFTKGTYGLQAVAICTDGLYSLPNSKTETIKALINDKEACEKIIAGKCELVIRRYFSSRHKRMCYDVNFKETTEATNGN